MAQTNGVRFQASSDDRGLARRLRALWWQLVSRGEELVERLREYRRPQADRRIESSRLGPWGEHQAARYLQRCGYRIVTRGYRNRYGEIDLVAIDGNTIVFVEVKTWSEQQVVSTGQDPSEAIDKTKESRVTRAALAFLKQFGLVNASPIRFDIISIVRSERGRPQIRHFLHAFTSPDTGQFIA